MRLHRLGLFVFIICFGPILVAYLQWAFVGLPTLPHVATLTLEATTSPRGFPVWLRITHYVNFLLLILLVRSGLQILMDHPRLYWNVHCTPGTEWIRLTPVVVPRDRVWTARDDARHLSPWIGLPGYRHTVGMARHWHFLSALFWVGNGLIYVILLLSTNQWYRLVPTSLSIIPDAWSIFVHYVTFHLPPEPDGFYAYNALQQLSYFGVVFILAPAAILTGPAMSPAFTARFKWYPKLPGNRQVGRSLHFLVMATFVIFLLIHVVMVGITGFARNMNHIALGTDDTQFTGIYVGILGIVLVAILNALANWVAWRRPRSVQHVAKRIITPIMRMVLDRSVPKAQFSPDDISPFFWVNGKVPTSDKWTALAGDNFRGYRLQVKGLVDNPVELSLTELERLGKKSQITLHHCIQGWSGIAEWGGLPLTTLIDLVMPKPEAKVVMFYSFGEGGEGGRYYDSLSIENARHSQTILAYEMNGEALGHLHGAPLRLRVENQLGFKMVKWIESIEFVASMQEVGKGEGGYAEDNEYFGELANI